jgi:hypothetical protein
LLAEVSRRQVNAQLHHAGALTWATWALVFLTAVLAGSTVLDALWG